MLNMNDPSMDQPVSYFGDDEDDNATRQLARLVAPAPAEDLVPRMPLPMQPTSSNSATPPVRLIFLMR